MSDLKRLRAANYYQQKARRAQTELRWHMSTLPGAITGFIFSSFEFVIILTLLGLFALTQLNPSMLNKGTFQIPQIQLPWLNQSSTAFSKATMQPSGTKSISTAGDTPVKLSPAFKSITKLSKRQLGASLLGADRPAHFSGYFDYLASRRDLMPTRTYQFFADYDRYSLGNNKSVYGLWIKNVQERNGSIDLELTDAAGMRNMVFSYHSANLLEAFRWREAPAVVSHELIVADTGAITHSFAFRDNSIMQIAAEQITVSER